MKKRIPAARQRALEWILMREPVGLFDVSGPNLQTVRRLVQEGDVEVAGLVRDGGRLPLTAYRLSVQGRKKLHLAMLDIGRDALTHLETMYPVAFVSLPASGRTSLRNFINNRVLAALDRQKEEAP